MTYNPENWQKYQSTHKEQLLKKYKKYYQEHKEAVKETKRKYQLKNREKINKMWREKHGKYNLEYEKHKREYDRRYRQIHNEHIKEINGKYRKTEMGKITRNQSQAKRRNKKWIQILPNVFPEDISVDYHHVDGKWFVVPLPRVIHRKKTYKNIDEHIKHNIEWIEFFYDLNPNDLLYDGFSSHYQGYIRGEPRERML